MKFLILNTNYPESILWLYAQNHGLEWLPYEKYAEAYLRCMPGMTYFYAVNLRKLGYEDLMVAYSNAITLIYPSLYDGFGFSLLSAFECEIPVIASRRSTLPEAGGDACLYVDV